MQRDFFFSQSKCAEPIFFSYFFFSSQFSLRWIIHINLFFSLFSVRFEYIFSYIHVAIHTPKYFAYLFVIMNLKFPSFSLLQSFYVFFFVGFIWNSKNGNIGMCMFSSVFEFRIKYKNVTYNNITLGTLCGTHWWWSL